MIVHYSSNKLERECTNQRVRNKAFGQNAERIANRIAALEDAVSFEDLRRRDPLGRWEVLTADLAGKWSGRASKNHRVIVEPGVVGEPSLIIEEVTVESVKLDYHGK